MQAPFTLEGKVALVTGSGRGIGRAVAQKLAACGASVMLTDIDEAPVRQAAAAAGTTARWLAGDLTAPDFPQKLVDATVAAFGSLDIIVNNAGYVWDNVIQKMTEAINANAAQSAATLRMRCFHIALPSLVVEPCRVLPSMAALVWTP